MVRMEKGLNLEQFGPHFQVWMQHKLIHNYYSKNSQSFNADFWFIWNAVAFQSCHKLHILTSYNPKNNQTTMTVLHQKCNLWVGRLLLTIFN